MQVCGSWPYEADKGAYVPSIIMWDYTVYVLPFLLVLLVGGRAFLAMHFMILSSLASHTLQSQEKEGLVTMCIDSYSVGMQ